MEKPSGRYYGMAAYDLRRYFDLLMIMRDFYQSYRKHDRQDLSFGTAVVSVILIVGLLVWAVSNDGWFVFSAVLALTITLLIRAISKRSRKSKFESIFISRVMKEGYSRADAIEFLYDIDWDDIQYEESHIDQIREDLKHVKD